MYIYISMLGVIDSSMPTKIGKLVAKSIDR